MGKNNRAGFTLIELLVSIVSASLVMAAAVSLLLMAIRFGAFGGGSAQRQNTVRIMQTMLTEADIQSADDSDQWKIIAQKEENSYTLLGYDGTYIYTGDNQRLMDVEESTLTVTDGTVKQLLTLSIKKDGKSYTLSAAFGDVTPPAGASVADSMHIESTAGQQEKALSELDAGQEGRKAFLQLLFSQMESTGNIIGIDGAYAYYTEWYINGYSGDWNADTPWCACFLSWAADQLGEMQKYIPRFADVQNGVEWFKRSWTQDGVITIASWKDRLEAQPQPGDLVFFDFDGDGRGDHIGAVLYTENGRVFTVEGNVSDRVAVVSYDTEDIAIMGYASLYWK